MPDADQALGQDVDEEASQELIRRDRHHLVLAAGCIVLPSERDAVILEADQAMVGDRHAVGAAGSR